MEKVSLNVLIVEEDEHWRERFQQELERLGATTTVLEDKCGAVKLAGRKKYDLHISGDIMFCYRVREMRPEANILFIPGRSSETQRPIPKELPYIYKGEFSTVIYDYIQTLRENKASKGKA